MPSIDDFRFESHHLLLELDAATMGMMTLVSSRCVSGPAWDAANERQREAYRSWDAFMNTPPIADTDKFPAKVGTSN